MVVILVYELNVKKEIAFSEDISFKTQGINRVLFFETLIFHNTLFTKT